MKRKIYKNMYFLTLISILATTILLFFIFYGFFDRLVKKEVKNKAVILATSLDLVEDNSLFFENFTLSGENIRVTYILSSGLVVFDNTTSPNLMNNHSNRPEFGAALEMGYSQEIRLSETLGEKTYYYAIKLNDGNIIRVSQTTKSFYTVFISTVPLVCLVAISVFLLSELVAARLTKKIVDPINEIDLELPNVLVYDELYPLVKKIIKQREQIQDQIKTLDIRATTIKTITQNMQEGLLMIDKNGDVLSANLTAKALFSPWDDKDVGKNIVEITRNMQILEQVKDALAGHSSDQTIELCSKIYQVFFSPVFLSERINGAIVLFLNITEKAKAEKLRKQFTANVSHELKTPLTTISGYAELIENGMVQQQDIRKFSGKIRTEASRLIYLIEDIIKLSELDESNSEKKWESFSLLELVRSVVESLRLLADERSVTLSIVGEDVRFNANKRMIFELFFNLIENGIKYNKLGGQVEILITNSIKNTKITVTDTGIGIPEQHLDRIFERFYRVDRSRSKKTGGTGLGLSIVKHIVEDHSGRMKLSSQVDVGTKIEIWL